MFDAFYKGFGIGLLVLTFAGCSAQQWSETMNRFRDVKEIMSGTCVRGESWEACIQKCEQTELQGGGGQGGQ